MLPPGGGDCDKPGNMNHDLLERLEQQAETLFHPQGPSDEFVTINVVYVQTIVDQDTGERREVNLPATYSDDVPFEERSPHKFFRVRYPIKEKETRQ